MLRSLCLICLPSLVPAATDDFRLEDYVPADFRRHYLSLSPSLTWENSETGDRLPENEAKGSAGRGFQGLSVRHGSKLQAQALRWSASSGLDAARIAWWYRQAHEPVDGAAGPPTASSSEGAQYQISAFAQGTVQWHFQDWFFLALTADPHATMVPSDWNRLESRESQAFPGSDSLLQSTSRRETDMDALEASVGVSAALGYGRIEDVGFAETALFLLDRIRAATGQDIRLSLQEVNALEAHLEARRKLRPFYDARMASIYDLEGVDAFLNARPGAERLSARAILEMADVWNHAGRHRRESGWELRIFPFFGYAWRESGQRADLRIDSRRVPADPAVGGSPPPVRADTFEADRQAVRYRAFREESRLGAALAMAYRRPWRRRFQFDWNASARASRVGREIGERTERDPAGPGDSRSGRHAVFAYPFLEAAVDGSAAFYPDTRTEVKAGIRASGWKKLDYIGSRRGLAALYGHEPRQDAWGRRLEANLAAEYYLGPRLSVYVRADAWRDRTDRQEELEDFPAVSGEVPPSIRGWSSGGVSTRASLVYYLF